MPQGKIVREAKVASEPEALSAFLASLSLPLTRVGLEAGPLSQWLHAGLVQAGFAVVLLETRHVKAALSAMIVKTDRRDARGIAQFGAHAHSRPWDAGEDCRGDAARPRGSANGVRPVASGYADHCAGERGLPAADERARRGRSDCGDLHVRGGRS
jgi:hypothetical protein